MSDNIKRVLENIKTLTPHEKATLAHCLIASLDEANEADVDDAWAQTAETRFAQLESGKVKAVSWEEIKLGLKRKA
ncbi:addiction module protein [Methylomonas sp. UP202]|uniref:addiction module protein n=1 Tax=Methylomonas sp. UP202 TaxID=3040943 RepID=UPI00247A64B2|nr:addiction module protein [Methylomonas sp. UP202]WGS84330.1 addiction module protein [Methylomonas sp. UP202]